MPSFQREPNLPSEDETHDESNVSFEQVMVKAKEKRDKREKIIEDLVENMKENGEVGLVNKTKNVIKIKNFINKMEFAGREGKKAWLTALLGRYLSDLNNNKMLPERFPQDERHAAVSIVHACWPTDQSFKDYVIAHPELMAEAFLRITEQTDLFR
ncbi:MAG TPA: hypothetical protein VLH19_03875 [Patescibacteria group bacterium]|nr:hypothetical protein [Patescibacteria group bacterium]